MQFNEHEAPISEREANLILHELYRVQEPPHLPGLADPTLSALSEVTGQDPETILRLLQEIRRKEREGKVMEVLLELEKPLYAVERPPTTDHQNDPLLAFGWKQKVVNSVLEDVEHQERLRKIGRKKLSLKPSSTDRYVAIATAMFLALILVLVLARSLSGG